MLLSPGKANNPLRCDFLVTILNESISNQREERTVHLVMSKRQDILDSGASV